MNREVLMVSDPRTTAHDKPLQAYASYNPVLYANRVRHRIHCIAFSIGSTDVLSRPIRRNPPLDALSPSVHKHGASDTRGLRFNSPSRLVERKAVPRIQFVVALPFAIIRSPHLQHAHGVRRVCSLIPSSKVGRGDGAFRGRGWAAVYTDGGLLAYTSVPGDRFRHILALPVPGT